MAALLLLCFGCTGFAQQATPTTRPQTAPAEPISETLAEFRPTVVDVENSQNLAVAPGSVQELLDLEARIRRVVEKVLPATVGLVVGQGQGSGVIVSPEGYVLTAAHVTGRPGQRVTVIMPDGTRYEGVSLGLNRELDDGLIKITDRRAEKLPWAPLGRASGLAQGTWTVALGHPGGYQQDRPPVVRVGRLLANNNQFMVTDNTLVGGDSGGPLFDLDGRVIGIHSRISSGISSNVHVPVDRFIEDWEALAGSEHLGRMEPRWMRNMQRATDGLETDPSDVGDDGARVIRIRPNGPADRAGIRINDRIIAIGDEPVQNGQDLMLRRMGLRAGEAVTYRLRRGEQELEVEVTPVSPADLQRMNTQRPDPSHAVLGVTLDQGFAQPGARLVGVQPSGPAASAGIQGGDIIQMLDGQMVRNMAELTHMLRAKSPGDLVELGVWRDGRTLRFQVKLGSRGDVFEREEE